MPNQRAALAILILVETAAFAYMSQTVVFPTAVAAAALVGLSGRWRYRMSQDRQVIFALVAALLFVVKWRVQPHQLFDDALTYLSPFLHSLGQFLLVLQTAALYLDHDRDLLPVTLPWPGVFVMVSAGDMTVGSMSAQRMAFQVFALAFTAATALFFTATARAAAETERRRYGAGKTGVTAALLTGTALLAWIAATGLYRYETTLNRLVTELLSPTMESSAAGFPSRARLGSVARRKNERSEDIALRVYSADEPGYLRGKAYHWLTTVNSHLGQTTQWEEASPPSDHPSADAPVEEVLTPSRSEGDRFVFDLRDPPGRPFRVRSEMEIWLEAPQWGTYFLPPQAAEVVTNESRIRRDYRQIMSGTDAGAVTYRVRTGPPPDRYPTPASDAADGPLTRRSLTFIPRHSADPDNPIAGSDPTVRDIADGIFAGCRTVEEHIDAVETYFRSKYGYAIGIDPPARQDPLRWFLVARPNAHCEYFAQAAAFLLRMRGIPTRYVTGFVVTERNEYGGYWLARNEHAHAWCEAWNDERGWVIVEATPPAGVPAESASAWHRQLWEYLSGQVARFRYRFGEEGWVWLLRQTLAFFLTPAGWVTVLLVVGYVAVRLRMRRAVPTDPDLSPAMIELNRLLRRMDRRTETAGLTRKPGETLARFAARVESETGDAEAAAWYAAYSDVRYGGIDAEAVETLRSRLNAFGPPPKRGREAVETMSVS